nr:hypothetical protein [uncultured Desulfobacter sp.]
MASEKINMVVNVKLKGEKKGVFADGFDTLYAFARLPNDSAKVFGKAKFDRDGRAEISITMPGKVAMPMEVEVSPLSNALPLKNIKTEKRIIRNFSEKNLVYIADIEIELNQTLYSYTEWLHEQFTVFGKLQSRYTDHETEKECTVGIPNSKVTLFEVDKESTTGPCLVDCMVCSPPVLCIPDSLYCTPLEGPVVCPPAIEDLEICTPSRVCAPWAYEPVGLDERIRWERDEILKSTRIVTSLKPPAAKKMTGPVKSPALPTVAVAQPIEHADIAAKESLSATVKASTPQLCGVSILPHTHYSKTELGSDETDANGNYIITFKRSDFLEAATGSTQTENVDWDSWPDLLFEASRFYDGEMRLLYQEGYDQTRWDIQTTSLRVDLIVQGQVPGVSCSPDDDLDPGQTDDLVFHGIGNVEPGWIDANGVISNVPSTSDLFEHVFGGTLDLFGQFKYEHIGKYYQVEYAAANTPNDWKPIANETWTYSKYLGNFQWEQQTKAPISLGQDFPYCYEIPDYTDHTINRKTLLMKWRTWRQDGGFPRYPNGRYMFRVRLLDVDETTNQAVPVAGYDPEAMQITVALDNAWPEADIKPEILVYDKGAGPGVYSQVPECGSVASADRYLIFRFRANDVHKHFRNYYFEVNRGAEDPVSFMSVNALDDGPVPPNVGPTLVQPSVVFSDENDNYPDNYTWLYIGKDYWDESTYGSFRPCAYNFRLVVRDRVTNGYGRIHWSDATLTLSIT